MGGDPPFLARPVADDSTFVSPVKLSRSTASVTIRDLETTAARWSTGLKPASS